MSTCITSAVAPPEHISSKIDICLTSFNDIELIDAGIIIGLHSGNTSSINSSIFQASAPGKKATSAQMSPMSTSY
jgi:hypothetical protein